MQSTDGFLLFQFSFKKRGTLVKQLYKLSKIQGKRGQYSERNVQNLSKIQVIASELTSRIRTVWKPEIISEYLKDGQYLPKEVINIPNIDNETLISMLMTNSISAEEGTAHPSKDEKIYININGKRYTVKNGGRISVEHMANVSEYQLGGKLGLEKTPLAF